MSGFFTRMASSSKGDDEDFYYFTPGDPADGASDDDGASIISNATTLVNQAATLPYVQTASATLAPLGDDKIFASFVANYAMFTPRASSYIRLGLPAQVKRGQNKRLTARLRKGIIVQLPLRPLRDIKRHVDAASLEDIATLRQQHQATRNTRGIGTVWDFERIDLVGVRERELMGIVLASLLKAEDVDNAHLIYPAETIVRAPSKLLKKDGSALVPVKWATLRILAPASTSSSTSQDGAHAKESDAGITFAPTQETDEQLLARRFVPSAEAEELLERVLAHLERRGGVWTHAGHFTAKSFKNKEPESRPEFTVHGLFPTPLLQRMKNYRSKHQPMPSDLALPANDSAAPLILHTIAERGSSGAAAADAARAAQGVDALECFTVGVTFEPYRLPQGRWGEMRTFAA